MNNLIKSKLELLPTSPGCYIHKDKNGTIIYVGKAKNLRNRWGPISEEPRYQDGSPGIWDCGFWVYRYRVQYWGLCLRSTSSRRTSLSTISCSRMTSLSLHQDYQWALSTPHHHAPGQKTVDSILVPIQMWERPMRSSGFLDRFSHSKCTNPPSKICFYYHLGNVWPIQSATKTRPISRAWRRRFLISSRGRD